ncbi:MAG: hypothetical protein J3K34DRAFT_407096 [Monoraphidium minutum]|nr:MAG: hypothetical protein J3K34DRAFT_407096 [Monoraphidium minutum]
MKTFFWDKLPDARLANTLWLQLSPAEWVDFDALEEAFSQVQRAPRAAKADAAPKQVTLLDLKRCTAIGIRMARLRVPWQAAADAILSLDSAAFEGAEDVSTLVQCLPTEDERGTLQAYVSSGKPVELLSEAERFVLSLMAVPRAAPRLRAFSMRFVTAEKHAEAAAVFRDHAKAAKELTNSRTLRMALAVALAAGNFLNHGSRLGAAAGFRLKSLNKLADSRSSDGKSTLLQAVAREVCARLRAEDKRDDVSLLVDEVPHVVSNRLKSSLADAGEVVGQVESATKEIERELANAMPAVTLRIAVDAAPPHAVRAAVVPDNFVDVMSEVLSESHTAQAELATLRERAGRAWEGLLAAYGETRSSVSNDVEFWADMQVGVYAVGGVCMCMVTGVCVGVSAECGQ